METKLKPLKIYTFILFILLSVATLPCSKEKIKNNKSLKNNNPETENFFFSEEFRKVGWINNCRYRAVIHIQTYEQCKDTPQEQVRELLEMRALRNVQNELKTGLSREASIHILNLIKDYGVLLRPELECGEINIYYFDIYKDNLRNDFKNIQSIK